VVVCIATAGVTYYMTPKYTRVGYAPIQPVPYSHAKHVGELGLDCRYCHNTIDTAGSAIPTAQTCMNCHSQIKTRARRSGRPGQLPDGEARPVGPRPRAAELRLL
jgi:formate-dependent nitrite reductase cytochrome c552 subunit